MLEAHKMCHKVEARVDAFVVSVKARGSRVDGVEERAGLSDRYVLAETRFHYSNCARLHER